MNQSRHNAWQIFVMAILTLAFYANSFHVPFIFDDKQNIVDNPSIHLKELSFQSLLRAGFKSPCRNRPIPNISLALNYYAHGLSVMGYHIVNFLIHLTNGVLLFFLLKALFAFPLITKRYGDQLYGVPFAGALLWLIHPIQVQSVTYIVQRMTTLCAFFYLLSLLLYCKGRLSGTGKAQKAYYVLSGLTFVVALLSKEIAATLPFVVLLIEICCVRDLKGFSLKAYTGWGLMLMVAVLVLFLLFMGDAPFEKLLKPYEGQTFTLGERVMTQWRVVIFYISLLIWPHPGRLNLDHHFPLSTGLLTPPTTFLSLWAILMAGGLALYILKRDRLVGFCILWYFGHLVLESTIIPLDLVYEHRNYLPSMMYFPLYGLVFRKYVSSFWTGAAILIVLILLYGGFTAQRNQVWGDEVTLWQDCVNKSPNSFRSLDNLGSALWNKGRYEEAIEQFKKALSIRPKFAHKHNNLGSLLWFLGHKKKALLHYQKALRLRPRYQEAHLNLGIAKLQMGDAEDALPHFTFLMQKTPDDPQIHFLMGEALMDLHQGEAAASEYAQAILLDPGYGEAHYKLGLWLSQNQRFKEAIKHLQKAVKDKPQLPEAHYNLGVLTSLVQKTDAAIKHFNDALRIQPKYPEAHNNLGILYAQKNNLAKARDHFKAALRLDPDYEDARRNLIILNAQSHKVPQRPSSQANAKGSAIE